MQLILAIGLGGALGSIARHYLNNAMGGLASRGFPLGIFTINVAGSVIIGVLVGVFATRGNPPAAIRAFLTVGLLGGFTTFSTFSLDTAVLVQRGAYLTAGLYAAGSVVVAVSGLFGGMALARAWA